MLRLIQRLTAAAFVTGVLGAASLASDIDTVEKDIFEKMKATKSVQAKLNMSADMSDENRKLTVTGEGSVLVARHGTKLYQKSEQKLAQKMTMGETEMKQDVRQSTVSDGEWTYTISDSEQGKQCQKFKNPPEEGMPFQDLRDAYDLTVQPEESIDGAACYVIQATPKPNTPQASMQSKILLSFRKDSGFSARTVMFGADGKQRMETKFFDIVLNKDVPTDQFKAPEGIECTDMTEQIRAMMRGGNSAGAESKPAGN